MSLQDMSMQPNVLRIGTRNSRLALVQAELVADWLRNHHENLQVEIVGITTQGDQVLDKKLDKIGGKGLFIKELESALLEDRIDLAVHSAKDLPAQLAQGTRIVAVSEREDARDALVSRTSGGFKALPAGAVIGTSSARRESQLKLLRNDIQIKLLRGNVISRIEKMKAGEYDAIVLASAGVRRLGLERIISGWFSNLEMVPAVGQGILAIQASNNFADLWLAGFHDAFAWECLQAERATLTALQGDCSIPLGVCAEIDGGRLRLQGFYEVNGIKARASVEGRLGDPVALGENMANALLRIIGGQHA